MRNNDKPKTVYTKAQMIKRVARAARVRTAVVERVFDGIEREVFDALSGADADSDVSIRLFEGITFDSTYLPEMTKVNNLTGRTITTVAKIKAKASITRHYCRKLLGSARGGA